MNNAAGNCGEICIFAQNWNSNNNGHLRLRSDSIVNHYGQVLYSQFVGTLKSIV